MDKEPRMNKKTYNAAQERFKGKAPDEIAPEDMDMYKKYLVEKIRRMKYGIEKSEESGMDKKAKNLKRQVGRYEKYQDEAEHLHEQDLTETYQTIRPDKNTAKQGRQQEAYQNRPFKKKPVKDRSFDYRSRGDHVEAKNKTGMEKYARHGLTKADKALAEELEKESEKAREEAKDNDISDIAKYRNIVFHDRNAKEDYDYENMKGLVTMTASRYIEPLSAKIRFNDKGEAEVYGEFHGNRVVVATADKDHNLHFTPENEIKLQKIGMPAEEMDASALPKESGKAYAEEDLFSIPRPVDALMLVGTEDNHGFAVLDKNGNIYQGKNSYFELDPKEKKTENLRQSVKEIARVMGVREDSLRIVDDCKYIVSKSGHMMGILDSKGHVAENTLDIMRNDILYNFAKENGVPEDTLDLVNNRIVSQKSGRTLGDFVDGMSIPRENEVTDEIKDLIGPEDAEKIKYDPEEVLDAIQENLEQNIPMYQGYEGYEMPGMQDYNSYEDSGDIGNR